VVETEVVVERDARMVLRERETRVVERERERERD
jgi:hypothetical protein